MSEFSYLSGDFFQQASFQPSHHSGLLLTGGAWATIAGPWLPSAVSQLKARLMGRIHQGRLEQGKFGICSIKVYVCTRMQFLSEI